MTVQNQNQNQMRCFGLLCLFASVVGVIFGGAIIFYVNNKGIVAQNDALLAKINEDHEAMLTMRAEVKDLQATRAENEKGSKSYSHMLKTVGWSVGSLGAPIFWKWAKEWAMEKALPAVEPAAKYGCVNVVNYYGVDVSAAESFCDKTVDAAVSIVKYEEVE
jgi:hypothetical protein